MISKAEARETWGMYMDDDAFEEVWQKHLVINKHSTLEKLITLSEEEDQCWVTRADISLEGMSCLEFIGGFVQGKPEAKWTEEMCCLPCRLRAIVKELQE